MDIRALLEQDVTVLSKEHCDHLRQQLEAWLKMTWKLNLKTTQAVRREGMS